MAIGLFAQQPAMPTTGKVLPLADFGPLDGVNGEHYHGHALKLKVPGNTWNNGKDANLDGF